jgi:uncharacterized delta-60 repeat protein
MALHQLLSRILRRVSHRPVSGRSIARKVLGIEGLDRRELLCADLQFTTDFGGSDGAVDVAVQADGRFVVAGTSSGNFALARYHPNGSLDTSFGTNGKVIVDFGGTESAKSVAIAPDGKIVVAGRTGSVGAEDFAVARLNANGSLDATFNPQKVKNTTIGGTAIVDFAAKKGAASADLLHDMVVEADGEIVLLGRIGYSASKLAMAKLKANGTLDAGFGSGGKVSLQVGSTGVIPESLALQADGRFVVGGNTQVANSDFLVMRLQSNGAVDNTFGSGGKVTVDVSPGDDGLSVAIQPDGQIVLAGSIRPIQSEEARDSAVLRFSSGGLLDTSFGLGGIAVFGIGTSPDHQSSDQFESVVVQADGKIVLGGWAAMGTAPGTGNFDQTVVRIDHTGRLDASFANGGIETLDFSLSDFGRGLAVLQNGTLVRTGAASGDFTVALICP